MRLPTLKPSKRSILSCYAKIVCMLAREGTGIPVVPSSLPHGGGLGGSGLGLEARIVGLKGVFTGGEYFPFGVNIGHLLFIL